jgi:hypothetical protein
MFELGWKFAAVFLPLCLLVVYVRCQRGCWMREGDETCEEEKDEH